MCIKMISGVPPRVNANAGRGRAQISRPSHLIRH